MKYIAFLRGINVGGRNQIKMPELKKSLEPLNLRNIATYLQSGNVIFDFEPVNTKELALSIENTIEQTFGCAVTVIIRTADDMEKIIGNNPFIKDPDIEIDKLHATLLLEASEPKMISGLDLKKEDNENFIISGREVYLYCPNGYGRTKLNNAVFEKKLSTRATTGNWNTMKKLLELSKE
jgi:uncharacterized protein (DUF1697 family)